MTYIEAHKAVNIKKTGETPFLFYILSLDAVTCFCCVFPMKSFLFFGNCG